MAVNVIVPLDGSGPAESALHCGRSLAAKLGGHLVVVASTTDDSEYGDLAAYLSGLELPHESHREIRARLDAAKAIDTVTRQWAPSVVCMSAHGRTARTAAVLGSVTAQVLREGAAPVLIVGPRVDWSATTTCDSLLVCVDDTPDSMVAVEPARQLATELGVPLNFVTVVEQSTTADNARDAVRARLAENDETSADVEVVVAGDVASALVQQARARPGTVLAMGTHGRTRAQKLVAGSATLSVIRHAGSPVLAVPPHRAATSWRDWGPAWP